MAYLCRLNFLLILEKALTCISDELDVFRMVSRCDMRRACIVPYNSLVQFEYTTATEIQEVLKTEEGRECTERCNSIYKCRLRSPHRPHRMVTRVLECHIYLRLRGFGLENRLLGWPTP